MTASIGDEIGKYRLLEPLGEGGMGAVYLAEHVLMGKRVAVKLLRPEVAALPEVTSRFLNEARAVARVQHPGIVEVFDCGVDEQGRSYLAMELLRGEGLGSFLRRHGALGAHPALVRRIARDTALAVSAAHAAGIVHRDLKPDNLYLCAHHDGPGLVAVKVLDFGVAKLAPSIVGLDARSTRSGMLVGTALYMSPEQCRGSKLIDHRTDIYALGCIVFELCAGRPPFVEEALGATIAAHLTEAPPRLGALVPGVARDLDELVAAMLSKDAAARPPDMGAVAAALAAGLPASARTGPIALPAGLALAPPGAAGPPSPPPGAVPPPGASPPPGARPVHATAVLVGGPPVRGTTPMPASAPLVDPEFEPPTARGRTTLSASAFGASSGRRWRSPAGATLGAVAVLALVGGGVALWATVRGPGAVEPGVGPPSGERRRPPPGDEVVRVDVAGVPAGARVLLDGRPAALPLRLPRARETHELRVEADGFEPHVEEVSAAVDGAVVLALVPRAAPPLPVTPSADAGAREATGAGGAAAVGPRVIKPGSPSGRVPRRSGAPTPGTSREGERRVRDLILDI